MCIVRNGGAIAGHVSADWSSSIVVVVVIVPGFGSLTCEEPALVVFDEVAELPPRRLLMLLLLPKNLRRLKPFPDSAVTDSSDCLEAAGERRVGSRVCGECGGGE